MLVLLRAFPDSKPFRTKKARRRFSFLYHLKKSIIKTVYLLLKFRGMSVSRGSEFFRVCPYRRVEEANR